MNESSAGFDPFRHGRMAGFQFGAKPSVRENDAILAIQRPACSHGSRYDVDLKRHARRDAFVGTGPYGRMNPLVVAGEMAGIEGRPQAAARQRRRNRLEQGLACRSDVRRLVLGDEAVEISGRGLQEGFVMVRNQPSAGGQAAPKANSGRDAIASICDPVCGRAQADHWVT